MLVEAVRSGLDVQLECDGGGSFNLLQWAVFVKRPDLIRTLVKLGATLDGGVHLSTWFEHCIDTHDSDEKITSIIQALGNQANHQWITMFLFDLLQCGKVKAAKYLFRQGVDPWCAAFGRSIYGVNTHVNLPYQVMARNRRREAGLKAILERLRKEKPALINYHKNWDKRWSNDFWRQDGKRVLREMEAGELCVLNLINHPKSLIAAGVALRRLGLPCEVSSDILKIVFF
jgi:hypothetical protein